MKDPRRTCYRVRRFPTSYGKDDLIRVIAALFKLAPPSFTIHSLALEISGLEAPRDKTATVSFCDIPVALRDPDKQEWRFELNSADEQQGQIYFDIHFKGFTPLTPEGKDSDCEIECIFIHGWGGHALGSFMAEDSPYIWPRDGLPRIVPKIRIWTYGYGSRLTDSSCVSDYFEDAERLRSSLRAWADERHLNPIMFVAHSLGGFVLKQAMVKLSTSANVDDKLIFNHSIGALLFGVPGHGMETTALASMVEGLPSEYTVNLLSKALSFRQRTNLEDDFRSAWPLHDFHLFQFFEQQKTSTVILGKDGKSWCRNGPLILLVDPASATSSHVTQEDSQRRFSIDKNHNNLVKFSDNDREDFATVCSAIRTLNSQGKAIMHNRTKSKVHAIGLSESHFATVFTAQNLGLQEGEAQIQATKLWFLDNLYSESLELRQEQVIAATVGTYEWILDSSCTDSKGCYVDFTKWLKEDGNLFWITGKPGSGKSTLMKFIISHPRTTALLHAWSGSRKLAVANFYFWISGLPAQRSLKGLLQSIFRQILQQDLELIPILFPREWRLAQRNQAIEWTTHSFMVAVKRLLSYECTTSRRFCFFIDGLDEYEPEGDYTHEWLCLFLARLASIPNIKMCLTSRPYSDFVAIFRNCPHLELHQWTEPDIQVFVSSEIGNEEAWQQMQKAHPVDTENFLKIISLRAQGVFLWVFLAMRSLKHGLHRYESVDQLYSRLNEMPQDLHAFFQRMIERMEPNDRKYAIKILLLTRDYPRGHHSLLFISHFEKYSPARARKTRSEKEVLQVATTTMQRLQAICGDLLQIKRFSKGVCCPWPNEGSANLQSVFDESQVTFSHRTVRDFLHSPTGAAFLAGEANEKELDLQYRRAMLDTLHDLDGLQHERQQQPDWSCRLSQYLHFWIDRLGQKTSVLSDVEFMLKLESASAQFLGTHSRSVPPLLSTVIASNSAIVYIWQRLQNLLPSPNGLEHLIHQTFWCHPMSHSLEYPYSRQLETDGLWVIRRTIELTSFRLYMEHFNDVYLTLEKSTITDDQQVGLDVAHDLYQNYRSGTRNLVRTYRSYADGIHLEKLQDES